MKIQDAYILINNLNLKDPVRKFGPTWSYIFVNEQLEIIAIEKYKRDLCNIEEQKIANKYKGSVLIIARLGDYDTVNELEERVNSCKDIFEYIRKNP